MVIASSDRPDDAERFRIRCEAKGPMSAWKVKRTGPPRCNRPLGDAGQHRRSSTTAELHAEWEDQPPAAATDHAR